MLMMGVNVRCTQRTNVKKFKLLQKYNSGELYFEKIFVVKKMEIVLMVRELATMWNSYSEDFFLHTQAA